MTFVLMFTKQQGGHMLQDASVYPPNMYSFTLTIVTEGPLPSQLLWNVDAAQPSVLACQHLTKSVRDAVGRTGSKNEISFPKYLLGSRFPSIIDAPRPPACVKETPMKIIITDVLE